MRAIINFSKIELLQLSSGSNTIMGRAVVKLRV